MKFFNQFARIFGFKININNIIEERFDRESDDYSLTVT